MGSVALFVVVNGPFFLKRNFHRQWWCPLISLSQGLLLINVLGNQILKKRGSREDQERWAVYWSCRMQMIIPHQKVPPSGHRGRILHEIQPGDGKCQGHLSSFQASLRDILHLKFCVQEALWSSPRSVLLPCHPGSPLSWSLHRRILGNTHRFLQNSHFLGHLRHLKSRAGNTSVIKMWSQVQITFLRAG